MYFTVAPTVSILSANRPDLLYIRGSDVVLLCETQGGPENTIQWLNDERALTEEDGVEITDANNSISMLTVSNISAAEGGAYTCEVTNAAGTSNATTSIFVFPYFTSQPEDVGGVNGTTVTLTCLAQAFPEPVYTWLMGNTTVSMDSEMLEISPLMFGDQGVYSCLVTSGNVSIQSDNATLSGKISIHGSYMLRKERL